MSILPIRTLGDPVLRTSAQDVDRFDRSLRRLHDQMLETMYAAPGVGLAAPQVGLSMRFFVFDAGDGAGPGALANPQITMSEGDLEEDEGCLSIPGVYHVTPRSATVRISGLDLDGRPSVLEGEGLLARIFQHETDHVNGLLFIDRLTDEGRREVLAAVRDRELNGDGGRRSLLRRGDGRSGRGSSARSG
jgi:peptide deformylase